MANNNFFRSNWFPVILTWTGTLIVILIAFYFNTNNAVSAHETRLKQHDTHLEKLDGEMATKASMEFVEKMRVEREDQVKSLTNTKADKDYIEQVDKKIDLVIQMLRDANKKMDDHINREK